MLLLHWQLNCRKYTDLTSVYFVELKKLLVFVSSYCGVMQEIQNSPLKQDLSTRGKKWLFSSSSHSTHREEWLGDGRNAELICQALLRVLLRNAACSQLPLSQVSYHIAFKYSSVRNLYKYF